MCGYGYGFQAAPSGTIEVREATLWEHRHPDPMVEQDIPISTWSTDHVVEMNEVRGRTEVTGLVIRNATAVTGLSLVATDLVGPCGTIDASNIDLRVAKFWQQGEFGWVDIGIASTRRFTVKNLIPELLLKNDALIEVDESATGLNEAQVGGGPSTIVLNPHTEATGRLEEAGSTFDFDDSATLQTFDLEANRNKWITMAITAPAGAASCDYEGAVYMSSSGGGTHGAFRVRFYVRPLTIAESGRFIVFYRAKINEPADLVGSETKNLTQYRDELLKIAYMQYRPISYEPVSNIAQAMDEMNTAGLGGGPFYTIGLSANNYTNDAAGETAYAADCTSVLSTATTKGFTEVWSYVKDEPSTAVLGDFLARAAACQATGVKTFLAGDEDGQGLDAVLGDPEEIDLLIDLGHPKEANRAVWSSNSREILTYSNRQTEIEDPHVTRRNYGVVLWAQDHQGAGIYAFQDTYGHIYADDDATINLRDAVICYPTRNACIPTLQLEGYREGVDDYQTLKALEAAVIANPGTLANAAQAWLNTLEASIEDADNDGSSGGGKTDDPDVLDIDLLSMRETALDYLEQLQ